MSLNEAVTEANLRIVDPPVATDSPIYPSRTKSYDRVLQ